MSFELVIGMSSALSSLHQTRDPAQLQNMQRSARMGQDMAAMQNMLSPHSQLAMASAQGELERARTAEFISRNIGRVIDEADPNVKRATEAERALAAERVARLTAEAERDELRRQVKAHRPEFIRALMGPAKIARGGVDYVPNGLWLATSIALVVAGVLVML